jgi:hypothetical protein
MVVATWEFVMAVTPTDAAFELLDSESNPITPDSTTPAGTYTFNALEDSRVAGIYSYSITKTGYSDIDDTVDLQDDVSDTADLVPLVWDVVFTVDPTDSTFELLDADSAPVTPTSILPTGTYTFSDLPDSRAVGDYSWSAIKTNYVTQTDTYSAIADDSEAIALYLELTSIEVTTPPTKTAYSVGEYFDPAGAIVTATFADLSTADVTSSVTWTPTETLTALDIAATASYLYHGVTETADTPITVT